MGEINTPKQINPAQLADEIGSPVSTSGEPAESTGLKTVTSPGITDANLTTAVDNHVMDPNWGLDTVSYQLAQYVTKAQQVNDGTATFTSGEIQDILSLLVLKSDG